MKPNKTQEIDQCIFIIREKAIMIDRDIAHLFRIPTKRINEMLKRNVNRFPDYYFFRLTEIEKSELVANCDRLGKLKHSSHPPIAFTEYGVSMLATLAKSEIALTLFPFPSSLFPFPSSLFPHLPVKHHAHSTPSLCNPHRFQQRDSG